MIGSGWLRRVYGPIGRSARKAGTRLAGRSRWATFPYQVAYVVLLDDAVHNYVRRLQVEILDECGSNLGLTATPHVTLKLGFPAAAVEPFASHLDTLASSVAPFAVRLRGFGFFGEEFAYLDVEQDADLDALRRRVVQEVADRFGVEPYPLERGDGFHFHVTLAHGLPRRQFQQVQRRLARIAFNVTSPAAHLALLFRREQTWITYRRVPPSGPRHPVPAPARPPEMGGQ